MILNFGIGGACEFSVSVDYDPPRGHVRILDLDRGTSVTNSIEIIATLIYRQYLAGRVDPNAIDWLATDSYGETSKVFFAGYTTAGGYSRPSWMFLRGEQ